MISVKLKLKYLDSNLWFGYIRRICCLLLCNLLNRLVVSLELWKFLLISEEVSKKDDVTFFFFDLLFNIRQTCVLRIIFFVLKTTVSQNKSIISKTLLCLLGMLSVTRLTLNSKTKLLHSLNIK